MLRINNLFFLFVLLLLISCIKEYDPSIDGNQENKIVVTGRITNVEGWQAVEVALSSPIQSPAYIPVGGCLVQVHDNRGNVFTLDEWQPGQYQAWMRQIDLMPGASFRVTVVTPEGEILESGFDPMPDCPPIDSLYYAIEEVPTTNPSINHTIMQFYVDLNAEGNYSQFYKWDVEETWEYHAPLPAQYYYDGAMHEIIPPDSSNMVCYTTAQVKNVFTVSTKNLSQNLFYQYPLHSVDGETSRLGILYSILVSQYALSEGAYNYWDQLRINSNDQGGLYEKQPLAIKGNILNKSNPDKEVLGYFYAASVMSKRYFYHDVEGIYLSFDNYCYPESLGKFGWREFFPWQYPIYYFYNETGALRTLNLECVDCRKLGGTTVKPDFWP